VPLATSVQRPADHRAGRVEPAPPMLRAAPPSAPPPVLPPVLAADAASARPRAEDPPGPPAPRGNPDALPPAPPAIRAQVARTPAPAWNRDRGRLPRAEAPAEAAQTIAITIGRVEIRAAAPAPVSRPAAPSCPAPGPSILDQQLGRRNRGSRS
jgi:hypothetical protein